MEVTLVGLTKRSDLNGQTGRLVHSPNTPLGRCVVALQSGEVVCIDKDRVLGPSERDSAGRERPRGEAEKRPLPAHGGIIACCGISDDNRVLGTAECFDTESGTWSPLPPLHLARCAPGYAVADGRLHIIGGEGRPPVTQASPEETAHFYGKWWPQAYSQVEAFDPVEGAWERLPSLLEARSLPVVSVVHHTVYAMGGREARTSRALNSAECLEPGATAWRRLPPMKRGRVLPVSGVVNGKIYICGGLPGCWQEQPDPSAECFDPEKETWMDLPSMMRPRLLAGSAELGNHVYVCGGLGTTFETQRHVERLNTVNCRWEAVPPMWRARAGPCVMAVSISGRKFLLACGGHNGNPLKMDDVDVTTVERYSPADGSWEILPTPMPSPRSMAQAVVRGDHVYVMGGTNEEAMFCSMVVRYNCALDVWDSLPPMESCRFKGAAAGLP